MKALIYARQSSGKDDFSESVEAQIANCKKLAAKEKLEIIGVYKDLNTSGETYPAGAEEIARLDKAYMKWALSQSSKKDFRLGLYQVLQKLPEVDFVLVNELTRLYRPINGSFLEGTGFFLNGAVRLIAIGTPSKFPKRNSLRNLKEEIGGER